MARARRVTRSDIEAKLREVKESAQGSADAVQGAGGRAVGTAGFAGAVAAAYLMGRRRGRKRRTVVEIRRI